MLNGKPDFRLSEVDFRGTDFIFDVDGTLVAGLQEDPEYNFGDVVHMITELYRRGANEVIFATGRPPWALRNWVQRTFEGYEDRPEYQQIMSTHHVMFDGAVIASLRGDVLFEKAIPSHVVTDLRSVMEDFGVGFGYDTMEGYYVSEGYDETYFPAETYWSLDDLGDNQVYAGYLINFAGADIAQDVVRQLEERYDGLIHCNYFRSFQSGHCIVVNPFGVNKALGVEQRYQLEGNGGFSRLVFFGDGENDEAMFEWALVDSRVIAVPSPKTKDDKHLLKLSKWNRPEQNSVGEVLGLS